MMPTLLPPRAAARRTYLRILLADDNVGLRTAIGRLLEGLGHSVEAVPDGREAVAAAARRDYDLAILDVQMPGMGGFEAARALRRGGPGGRAPRIVGLSGDPQDR